MPSRGHTRGAWVRGAGGGASWVWPSAPVHTRSLDHPCEATSGRRHPAPLPVLSGAPIKAFASLLRQILLERLRGSIFSFCRLQRNSATGFRWPWQPLHFLLGSVWGWAFPAEHVAGLPGPASGAWTPDLQPYVTGGGGGGGRAWATGNVAVKSRT